MTTGRDTILRHTTEAEWQRHVLLQAALGNWHGIHIRVSKGTLEALHTTGGQWPRRSDHDDAYGFPDLLLVNPERHLLLLPELKAGQRGRHSVHQQRWQSWLTNITEVHAPLWLPQDEQEVRRVLIGGKEG